MKLGTDIYDSGQRIIIKMQQSTDAEFLQRTKHQSVLALLVLGVVLFQKRK